VRIAGSVEVSELESLALAILGAFVALTGSHGRRVRHYPRLSNLRAGYVRVPKQWTYFQDENHGRKLEQDALKASS
jgi:hypothetical protein